MKKGTAALMVLLLMVIMAVLPACGAGDAKLEEGKVNVVTSVYPLYDFAAKIGGEYVHVVNIVPAGVEPHDWAPKSREVSLMSKSDLLLYQGGGFEGWVDDFLKSLPSDSGLKALEAGKDLIRPAAEIEHGKEETHEEGHDGGHESHEHGNMDPHTWLSPKLAKETAHRIKDALAAEAPEHKAEFEANYTKLVEQLDALDTRYRDTLTPLPRKEIVVQHEAFGYLCREYGLTQKPIMGMAPDAEPTAKQMKEIKEFVKANDVKYIFFEQLVSDKLAKTLAKDAGVDTLALNPLEGLTDEELKAGEDYFTVMERNLQNLTQALQ